MKASASLAPKGLLADMGRCCHTGGGRKADDFPHDIQGRFRMRKVWQWIAVAVVGLGLGLAGVGCGPSAPAGKDKRGTDKMGADKMGTDKMGTDKMNGEQKGKM